MLPSEFVLNVSLEKRGRTANGGFNSGHGLAGARLVRLTRTPIVILYAQPKTPIYSCDKRVRTRSGSGGITPLNLILHPVATAPGSDSIKGDQFSLSKQEL